ncbi:MAG: aminopeptidase [Lachnospiraceae bacterium]|jgi:leucyl aminopeptidase (aminopeptidase T)|nr:aminopeptidase [Lachnospiraceae bacterium]
MKEKVEGTMEQTNEEIIPQEAHEQALQERFALAVDRIARLKQEQLIAEPFCSYFQKTAAFVSLTVAAYEFVASGQIYQASLSELGERNHRLYEDILPSAYASSYADPSYAEAVFGAKWGPIASFLYTELRSLIVFAHEQRTDRMVIRMELLLEIYSAFLAAAEEGQATSDRAGAGEPGSFYPPYEEIKRIIYWFVSDYAELAAEEKIAALVDPGRDFALRLVMDSDLADLHYLYYFGEYVTDNELTIARHLLDQPEETIRLMARTVSEGFRKGFEVTGRDITKKKTVNVRFCLGFERMIRQTVKDFAQLGLAVTINRASSTILEGRGVNRVGYYGAIPNKQFDFDHKDDQALVLDGQLITRRLEALKAAYEQHRDQAAVFAGPAVVEVFGESPVNLIIKNTVIAFSDKQQQLMVGYMSAAGELQNRYIPGDERSFTIIAFPVPEIGDHFKEIFDETILINTLDYDRYRDIQQIIIDALDQGGQVYVKGCNGNRTELTINLIGLSDPATQTGFENCVADVNIPVGEVFTSPRLAGTCGQLHVTRVFLNELEYIDLSLTIKDGMVTDYSCANFSQPAENQKYIRDNLLHHHPTLPMGEFAIGTNTTAYMMGKKYNIANRLPILIAEKTGPHFAFGDTCYSHSEDVVVYNPNGKEIIARDNELSLLRKSDPSKAYFNCHTDITIPYDELGELSVVLPGNTEADRSSGALAETTITIIKNGRFVLPGCEELNKPFE